MVKVPLSIIALLLFVGPAKAFSLDSLFMSGGGERIIVTSPTAGAPGPVGILGAITAFGYSRKLRNRIRDAK